MNPQNFITEPLEPRTHLSRVAFLPVNRVLTGSFPDFVISADLNSDGHQDLISANFGSSSVSVLLGNGDGTFALPVQYPVGDQPQALAIADVNNDGKLDLVSANAGSNDISVLLGNGDGTFGPAANFATGNQPQSLAIADVNGDTIPDIVTANRLDNTVSVLAGNGDGTFASKIDWPTGPSPDSLVVSDLNHDGFPDIVTANRFANTISILRGQGGGTFATPTSVLVGLQPRSLIAADLNHDGVPDLITANLASNSITILIGNGNGTFHLPLTYATGAFPFAVVAADLNHDGALDLVVADERGNAVTILLGAGNGAMNESDAALTGHAPGSVAVADFNDDSIPDIVTADFNPDNLGVLLSTLKPSSVNLTSSQNPVPVRERVVFTATVSANGQPTAGAVRFFDRSTLIGIARVNNLGVAFFADNRLAVGDQQISAVFTGNVRVAGSVSNSITQTIVPGATQAQLTPTVDSLLNTKKATPGIKAQALLTIDNQGGTLAAGRIAVNLFASTDQTLSNDDVALSSPTLANLPINLAPGVFETRLALFTIPNALAPGNYFLLVELTPISGLLTSDIFPSTTASATTFAV